MIKLYKHQEEAIRKATLKGNLAIFHDPGLGKTRTCLEIYKELKKTDTSLKLLVICPLSLINTAWGDDTKKFTNFKFLPYKDIKSQDIYDITAINYESLISRKYLPQIKDMVINGRYMVVLDESSRLKSYKSITTKVCLDLAKYFKYRYICSGTPAPNSELELWGQMRFISTVLPESFFAFRNIYFCLSRGKETMTGQIKDRAAMRNLLMRGWKYAINSFKKDELYSRIAPYVDWVKKEDALDLPEQIDQIREVTLDSAELKAYEDMRKHLIVELKDTEIVAQTALTKIMKLRQATSGFFYDSDRVSVQVGHSKRKVLEEVLEELGDKQVIIWVQFKEEVAQLVELLGDKAGTLYSETEDKDKVIVDFKLGRTQYCIAHPRSAAHGITLVNCSYQIFYSLDYSWEAHEQARARIHRIGQTNKCTYIYLLAKKSIDYALYNVLQKKQAMQEAMYEVLR